MVLIQKDRIGEIDSALGPDTLNLIRLSGRDYMNGLFQYRVECIATDMDLDADGILGTHATVKIKDHSDAFVHFDGIVTEFDWLGIGENGYRYGLILKPWFWLASLRRNQRIFHEKTVVEILQEVLGEYSDLGAYQTSLTETYEPLEYTVQYRESDLDFCCRLMERFGISYHFKHEGGGHTMVLTDTVDSHDSIGMRVFRRVDGKHRADEEHFWDWRPARRMTTGAIRLTDYNFKEPTVAMETEQTGDGEFNRGTIESYDYPGEYLVPGTGNAVVGLRVKQERGQDRRYTAEGDTVALRAGLTVTTSGDETPGGHGEFLCLSAEYSFTNAGYGSGSDETEFVGRYRLMPVDAPLAPERKTRRGRVWGPQTAKVVGEGEIDCDEFGRILVQFHWDLDAAYSMRCRVSQNWAGAGWGGMVIPRVNMEVLVEFIEGDPDQPLVTGCVYNGRNGVPYELPAHKTKSVLRSDTHEGAGYNEISFEDAAGEENLFMHAQKDMTTKVLNNQTTNVLANRVENIGANTKVNIGGNRIERVGGSQTQTVGGGNLFGLIGMLSGLIGAGGSFLKKNAQQSGANDATGFAGDVASVADLAGEVENLQTAASFAASSNHVMEAGKDQAAKGASVGGVLSKILPQSGILSSFVEKFHSDTVGIARTEQIGAARSLVVGVVNAISVGKKMNTIVGEDYELEAQKSILTKTRKHTMSAMDKVVIGGPGGTIIIDQSGIKIKALTLKVLCPSVDFEMGGPDMVEVLSTDKPFAEKCPKK